MTTANKQVKMDKRSNFIIPFSSLPMEEHYFDFEINDSFFQSYEHHLIDKANVKVHITLLKAAHGMQLSFKMQGTITLECGRCLKEFNMPVDVKEHLIVRQVPGEVTESDDENIFNISEHEHSIDLAPHLYDYLSLQVPLNPMHADNADDTPGCDPKDIEVLKKIITEHPAQHDARWDVLRNIKLN